MNIMNLKDTSIQFWDSQFKGIEPVKINRTDVLVESSLDKYLKMIGDHCETVIDIGCGMGTSLMTSLCLGNKIKKGVGLDTSTHAVDFANQTSKLSDFHELSYFIGDETYLDSLEDQSIDGIICSNFLDVIPKALSDQVIENIKRIMKPNGLCLIKINFYLDEARIQQYKMEEVEDHTYLMNGVIRSFNLPTEIWIERFKGLNLISTDGFRRAPSLPEDRILLFQKR